MQQALELAAALFAVLTLVPALAHALEYPGKLRLEQDAYLAIQRIYYPGFTIAGFGEPLAILATIALVVVTPMGAVIWWLALAALIALICMQVVYWVFTHPVNKFWLEGQKLGGAGSGFFAVGSRRDNPHPRNDQPADWTALRDRWERSHVARAAFALTAVVCLLVELSL